MFNKTAFHNPNVPEYAVSEVADAVKNVVEDHFPYIRIRGEVSGLKIHSSGHIYFNLKDAGAVINAVCFRNVAGNLKILPEEGLEIVVTGKITTYKARSNYQVLVSNLELAGAGALMAIFEKRKKALEAEGLFLSEHKKPIPKIPNKIAVITSETGAVFHDICHRIEERYPCEILLYPVQVQGRGAEINIANAINEINELTIQPDVLIVARGGGSVEDLWCFNEEIVVRAAFASKIPLISAIGHETDTTLIDYVSDLRAPTPTAAAEFATPDKTELTIKIDLLGERVARSLHNQLNNLITKLNYLRVPHPKDLLEKKNAELKVLSLNLTNVFTNIITDLQQRVLGLRINKELLAAQITELRQRLNNNYKNLESFHANYLRNTQNNVSNLSKLLESFSYKNVLKRGFAVVRRSSGEAIQSKEQFKDAANIEFADGTLKIK